jgi:hypothetical protein
MVNEKCLNLACGNNKIEGYYGIDVKKTDNVDYVMDLEIFPWDIESNSVENIICSHYVEHTPTETYSKRLIKLLNECNSFDEYKEKVAQIDLNAPSDGLILFMDECYRILKDKVIDPDGKEHGGTIKIIAPYYSSMRCWQDPTHRRAISDATFFYYNKGWRDTNRLEHYGIQCDFDFTYGWDIQNDWAAKHDEARNYGIAHYLNVINDIHVTLTKKIKTE